MIWWGIACELVLIALIVYAPPLQFIFGTATFPADRWLLLLTFVPVLLMIDEARKWLLRRRMAPIRGDIGRAR
jgi:hypothetical protein